MERLWSPWRNEYISATGSKDPTPDCVFCIAKADPSQDAGRFVVHRGSDNFVILNRYPYVSGHLMIVPYDHLAKLSEAPPSTANEMMALAQRCELALREVYRPEGFNFGMNLGAAAGAGVAGHIHLHVLPRWGGDTNFMSTVAETRVLPEDLAMTYEKLRGRI